jgi:hypothetical protein
MSRPSTLELLPRRRTFLDKALLYLFSYDVETDMDRDQIGLVPGGARTNIFARPGLSRVYHVMRERTVPGFGFRAITGSLTWGGDWALWREDDVELSEVQMTIHTDDGGTIHTFYPVVSDLGPGGFRRTMGKGKFGTEEEPIDWPVITSPRFETTSPAYFWLMDLQCLGFGKARIIKSEVRRLTYDVYALS